MIIGICGIKRSGSTAQFNMTRIALVKAGHNVNVCGHSYTPREVPEGEVDLVKRHPFQEDIARQANHIFITDRNDKDILKSLDRMWGSGDPERLADMRLHFEKWRRYATLQQDFDHLKENPAIWIGEIKNVLGLDHIPTRSILDEFEQITMPEKKQDPETLLFPNHISDV